MIRLGSELRGKLVICGPHRSGKTTLLDALCATGALPPGGEILRMHVKERMVRLEGDAIDAELPRVDVHDDVYGYDFVPVALGRVEGCELQASFFAFPGHPDAHDAIDRMWRGADVLVFVADSRAAAREENVRAWARVRANPWFDEGTRCVLVANRRDAPDALPIAELPRALAWTNDDVLETTATGPTGVRELAAFLAEILVTKAREV